MDSNSREREEELKDIYSAIDQMASSGMEFRRSIEQCVFDRLYRLFKAEGKEIKRDTKLSALFDQKLLPDKWTELSQIGFSIPELKRSPLFPYVIIGYLIVAVVCIVPFVFEQAEFVIALFLVPKSLSVIAVILFIPVILFMILFQKRYLPVKTIGELTDQIVSRNWVQLIDDDKAMYHQIMREEADRARRERAGDR